MLHVFSYSNNFSNHQHPCFNSLNLKLVLIWQPNPPGNLNSKKSHLWFHSLTFFCLIINIYTCIASYCQWLNNAEAFSLSERNFLFTIKVLLPWVLFLSLSCSLPGSFFYLHYLMVCPQWLSLIRIFYLIWCGFWVSVLHIVHLAPAVWCFGYTLLLEFCFQYIY